MLRELDKAGHVFICGVVAIALTGCGTIIHSERIGQKSGRIDAGVAVLDGVGLLFFLIPGIIAYAVDFSNGTIYLPGTSRSSLDIKDLREVKFDPKTNNIASVQAIIKKETGYDVKLYQRITTVSRLRSSDDMLAHFAEAFPKTGNAGIALLSN